jgi:Class III cytochrome C family
LKPLYVFIVTAITLVGLAVAFPYILLDPGHLLKGHQKYQKDCMSCHTPFKGVTSVQCFSCHKPEDISVKNVAGALLPKDNKKVLFHKGLAAESCIECHTDHKGLSAAKAIKGFKHVSLETSLRNNCIACHREQRPADDVHRYSKGSCGDCHGTAKWKPSTFDHKNLSAADKNGCVNCHTSKRPNDQLHLNIATVSCADCHSTSKWKPATFDHKRFATGSSKQCVSCHKTERPNDKLHLNVAAAISCGDCHNTSKWKPATFDHKKFAAGSGKQCVSCHKNDQPNDNMHRLSQAGCGTCHTTSRWKPATFNHDRYFRLDRNHQTSCKTCHTDPSNYRKYTCYNCHEHSASKMAAVHREEGIYNYQNCMKCHRNGTKDGGGGDD